MVSASAQFTGGDSSRETLDKRISPGPLQRKLMTERWKELANYLIEDLQVRLGYSIKHWLQGSYKFGTLLRPIGAKERMDIDLGIFVCWDPDVEETGLQPTEIMDAVYESLLAFHQTGKHSTKEVVRKSKCSRIVYDEFFHIDVPAYHLDEKHDHRTIATDKGWEESDPKAIYVWFKNQQKDPKTQAQLRRMVRYSKALVAKEIAPGGISPSSILLTVLVSRAFEAVSRATATGDDIRFAEVLIRMSEILSHSYAVPNPIDPSENLNRMDDWESEQLREVFESTGQSAKKSCMANNPIAAYEFWNSIFEWYFPLPSEVLAIGTDAPPVSSDSRAPEIYVEVVGRSGSTYRRQFKNQVGPIPKNCTLRFQISNEDEFPWNTDFEWMVRNEGDEADLTNDLGHNSGSGSFMEERSAYAGTHFMDCVARSGGEVVDGRRVPVSIQGVPAVRRNPVRRPPYTRLKRK